MAIRFIALIMMVFSLAPGARAADASDVERLAGAIAQEAAVRAHALARAPAAPAFAPPVGDPLLAQMQDFALQSLALSRQIEANDGPQDLRCIFRGMGRDVATRIEALETAADRAEQSRVYREIERLARQAGRIAAEPDTRSMLDEESAGAYSTCPASPAD